MKSIYILEIMAGVLTAVAILILGGKWYWAGITLVIGTPCAICLTAGWQATKAKMKRVTG